MNKQSGNKITSSHSTIIEVATPLIEFAQKERSITKISIGIIKTVSRPSPKRLKLQEEQACICLKIRGNKYIQEVRFYSENIPQLQEILSKKAKTLGFKI